MVIVAAPVVIAAAASTATTVAGGTALGLGASAATAGTVATAAGTATTATLTTGLVAVGVHQTVKTVKETVTGRDSDTGRKLSDPERAFRAGTLVPGAIAAGYGGARALLKPGKGGPPPEVPPQGPRTPEVGGSGSPGPKAGPLAKRDPEFATKQILGDHLPEGHKTPGGRSISPHAAERMVQNAKGRVPMTKAEVDKVLDEGDVIRKISPHPEGDTITIRNTKMPGNPEVVVDVETGKRVVTVVNRKARK